LKSIEDAKTPPPQTPADLAPLFSARGDRDLLNLMDDFFLTPTRFIDTALRDVMQTVAPLAQALPRMEITDEDKEYKIKVGGSISCL
jgi:hypothetical protein